ncbi:MAG: SURF1 family protein [Planktomarina sp.]
MRTVILWILAVVGTAVLLSLGTWQVQRLAWKETLLAEIEDKIAAAPVAIPAQPNAQDNKYMPVQAQGQFVGDTVRVLVSQKLYGAGYRLITAFETDDGRRILVDRGFVSVNAPLPPRPEGQGMITGNLHWPEEVDGFTPDNDIAKNIWFSRTVPELAAHLGTDPILMIQNGGDISDPKVKALPVGTDGIPNDHLGYAVTWYSLAVIWVGISAVLLYRHRRTAGIKVKK